MSDNYYSVLEKLSGLDLDERYEEINDFFCEDNLANYVLPYNISSIKRDAVRILFNNLGDIHDKVYDAVDKDLLCSEAYMIAVYIFDDLDAYTLFKDFLNEKIDYEGLDDYDRQSYIRIKELFCTYLIDLGNYKLALRLQDELDNIDPPTLFSLMRRGYCYLKLEMAQEIYDFYRFENIHDPLFFLYLLIALLKDRDEEKAELVYHEMLEVYPCAAYLDHPWDGDDSKDMQLLLDAIDAATDELRSVPDFFTFISNHKSRSMYS